ncbi:bestrophin-like domain [Streptomyces niger]|uniref:bestrophin-like domain n=1 Tax=Streptomyces niger TaxID=66373 RepID=UPI000699C2A7|nr:DUF4239 domain-containing protein [Streptomyces niger]
MLIFIVVAVLALCVGIALNRFLRPRLGIQNEESLRVRDLVGPLQTLTVLLVAFTLAMASTSHGKAKEAVRTEANALENLAEVAEYTPAPLRQRLRADVVCYARAVRHQEWPAMDAGHGSTAPNAWSTDMRVAFKDLSDGHPSFSLLANANKNRSEARQTRLAESAPTIPDTVLAFMLASLAVSVAAMGLATPRQNNKAHLTAITVVTALLTTALVIIHDVERPFAGTVAIPATAMANVEHETTQEYRDAHGAADLPCDQHGNETKTK